MSSISKRKREGVRTRIKGMGDHKEFLRRITKTLYYGELPAEACLSLPVTEISCELWSDAQRGRSLRRLHMDSASDMSRVACISPCALVLAILYLERLKTCNSDYLNSIAPHELFIVSLMVGSKFLHDEGEEEQVLFTEWASAGGIKLEQLKKLEMEFLDAIDWDVFVSDQSFEAGLLWLERKVALKQAQLRGFFTYTDLMVAYDSGFLVELVKSISIACVAVTLSYITSIITFVTSTLIVSNAWLPTVQYCLMRNLATTTVDYQHANVIAHNVQPDLTLYTNNATVDPEIVETILRNRGMPSERLKCCVNWITYQDSTLPKRNQCDTVVTNDCKLIETWWSRTSILNWLYQRSLINPAQKWLRTVNHYAELLKSDITHVDSSSFLETDSQYFIRHGLNLRQVLSFFSSLTNCLTQWFNESQGKTWITGSIPPTGRVSM